MDVRTGSHVELEKLVDGVEGVTFFDDDNWMVTADRGEVVRLRGVPEVAGEPIAVGPGRATQWIAHAGRALSISTTSDGKRLISSQWSLPDALAPHRLALSPDGRLIALADFTDRRYVDLFEQGLDEVTRRIPSQQCECVEFSPDGKWLAVGHMDDLTLFDLQDEERSLLLAGHTNTLSGAAFDPSSQFIATVGHDRMFRLWDVATGDELFSIAAHRDAVRAVAFSPTGETILTGGNDSKIKLWHSRTGQPLGGWHCDEGRVDRMTFDSTGLRLATMRDYPPHFTVIYDAAK